MKLVSVIFICFGFLWTSAQNIAVDDSTFSPQELVEDILIGSDCITDVVVTNVSGGNFSNGEKSYGYFDANGSDFPFQNGLVLSTGRLSNVPGPNNSLSDDDANNWSGDEDLEFALNESNTYNATIIEFDFKAVASQVSFRYIFASEEYQENNPNSCQYSDLFGFLIKPTVGQNQYENIAVVPNTNIPVKATTVTPGVPGSCPPQNDIYFGTYNETASSINFNGQTAVLTATANVVPNVSYHVKLVIADEQNYRYDSAVFLEAGSFELTTDLGPDRLIATNTALCEGSSLTLNAFYEDATYTWFKDGVPQTGNSCPDCPTYEVTEAGNYSVEVLLDNNCLAFGDISIEYAPLPIGNDATLTTCDIDTDGLSTFNLFDATNQLINNDSSLSITNFFLSEGNAEQNINPIANPNSFENTIPNQVVFARVINPANCYAVVRLTLQTTFNAIQLPALEACDGDTLDGIADFDLNSLSTIIESQIPNNATLRFYATEIDAFTETNPLSNSYQNTTPYNEVIYVKITSNNSCFSISPLQLLVLETPELSDDETVYYCQSNYPETLTLFGGVLNDLPNNYYYNWFKDGIDTGVTTSFNNINEAGLYEVVVTDPNGCSNTRQITVLETEVATIENITIEGLAPNNQVSFTISGSGDYQFTLDDSSGPYVSSPIFTNVSMGEHILYVRDLNGCALVETSFEVLGFPKFFTPNGDGNNDVWQIFGARQNANIVELTIFDRYGKLLARRQSAPWIWNGAYNGNLLSNNDYWFIVKFEDGVTYNGHFTLKR